jgi:hypothetical protein
LVSHLRTVRPERARKLDGSTRTESTTNTCENDTDPAALDLIPWGLLLI